MKLYNSATRTKEEFVPNHPDIVKMYTCGPTVYHYAHIGNLRSYIMEDVLEKYLRYAGYNVKRVMNITDVGHLSSDADTGEDKMLKGAKREHKTVMEIAKFYTDAFFDDCRKLNIKTPDVVEPATNCIDEYIKIISKLMDTGYAYFAGGNVYFDTSKLEKYYVFNDFDADDLDVGVREGVEEDTKVRLESSMVGEVDLFSVRTNRHTYFSPILRCSGTNHIAGLVLFALIIVLYNLVLATRQIFEGNRSTVFQSKLAITIIQPLSTITNLDIILSDVVYWFTIFGNRKGKGFVGIAKFTGNGFGNSQVCGSRHILCVEGCICTNGILCKIELAFRCKVLIRIPSFKFINGSIRCFFCCRAICFSLTCAENIRTIDITQRNRSTPFWDSKCSAIITH